MNDKKCCVVITTTDSRDVAMLIAKTLLEGKLAACIQMDDIQSCFCYEGEYKQIKEIRLSVKASCKDYDAIEKSIRFSHNYQLPQIIKLDITDGLSEYLDWVNGN